MMVPQTACLVTGHSSLAHRQQPVAGRCVGSSPATARAVVGAPFGRPSLPEPPLRTQAAPVPQGNIQQFRRRQTNTQVAAAVFAPSHTCVNHPHGAVELWGCYSVLGPAVIRKINNALVALIQPGGAISVLSSSSSGPTLLPAASLSADDDSLAADGGALVTLSGHHLELDGVFELTSSSSSSSSSSSCPAEQQQQQGRQRGGGACIIPHDGRLILSPAQLADDSCITLHAGGSVSHPICERAPARRPATGRPQHQA